ncbi:MAG TPA: hypothetical protein VM889_07615 [Candidatus Thermoplasmatota archaeon]|nr:hypothetical protein [Candidatus Thermoplasmatota archaeon]
MGPVRAPEGDITLATNAPTHWPRVTVPTPAGRPRAAVEQLAGEVARRLVSSGLEVVDQGRVVALGPETVRVDLVVRVGREEIPIFVFPGVDPEREGAMFGFLRAAMRETGAFATPALYYAVRDLGLAESPTPASIERAAEAFVVRAARSGLDLTYDAGPEGVVAAVRDLARAPVEAGGGIPVTEAASFVGEWLKRRVSGRWFLDEDLPRSVLVLVDPARGDQWQIPIFAWFPDAVRTGYDGLLGLLQGIVEDGAREDPDDAPIPVTTPAYRRAASGWLGGTLSTIEPGAESTLLLRRCASCGDMASAAVSFDDKAEGFEPAIARSLAAAGAPASECDACGGTDYRETVVLYLLPDRDGHVLVVTETFDSHVRVAAREIAFA